MIHVTIYVSGNPGPTETKLKEPPGEYYGAVGSSAIIRSSLSVLSNI